MSTLEQFRDGLQQMAHNISEGWQHLRDRASRALTRFTPVRAGRVETPADQAALAGARWSLLSAEVEERGNDVIVRLEVPGMDREDFDISVVDDMLVVRGEKRAEREQQEGRFYILECAYGAFERLIPLPAPVDESRAKARYRRGVLTVTLPKTTAARSRRIEVAG
ncbi:MAG TPA: Hsp20/alpha crystallin family protein [Gammaproteobacteria bacterium]|nr:Hsp20/alpha crystallin family protein [Gammaproteobacteria bacterium]